jgi:hypothetical protein
MYKVAVFKDNLFPPVWPIEYCKYAPCISDSSMCGCDEGIDATSGAVVCAHDVTEVV